MLVAEACVTAIDDRIGGRLPGERFIRSMKTACRKPRFEPLERWPQPSPCARPQALVRGRPGVDVELLVGRRGERKYLPVVSLKRVA